MTRRATSATFIGRDVELAQLERALDDTRGGNPTHTLLGGEAGVGKSRLTQEVVRRATDGGWTVLLGSCLDIGEGGAPFAPFAELLAEWVRATGRAEAKALAGAHAADLGRLVPTLGVSEGPPAQGRWAQPRIHDAIIGLCTRLSDRAPLLLVLEDLHWADADTLAATQVLLRAFEHEPVAILATYRSDDLHRRHPLVPWLAEATRAVRPLRIELAAFGLEEVRAIVTAVVGEQPSDDVVGSLLHRSDGNPFFLEELLVAGATGATAALPASLRDLLVARMAALSDRARRLVGQMAVVGRPVDDEELASLGDLEPSELREALREVIDASLLRLVGEDGYTFRHALVQEVAYDVLLPGERRQLHRTIAERLEARGVGRPVPGRAAELARHWRAARVADRALATSVMAGDEAGLAFAFAQATAENDHALALWEQVEMPEQVAGIDRIELLRRTAEWVYLASEDRRAIELMDEAVELSRAGSDPVRTGSLLSQLGRVEWISGNAAAAMRDSEEAVAIIPTDPPTFERARALAALGQIHMINGTAELAVRYCDEAIAVARACGSREAEGHALNSLGVTLAMIGTSAAGVAALEEALLIAEEERIPEDIGRSYVNLADALWYAGQPRRGLKRILEGADRAEQLGIGSVYGFYIRMTGVMLAFDLGEWDVAKRLYREANSRLIDSQSVERYRLAYGIWPFVAMGDPEGRALWERAWSLIPVDPAVSTTGSTPHFAGVELAIWDGRPREALAIADDGFERLAGSPSDPCRLRLARLAARAAAELVEIEGPASRPQAAAAADRYGALAEAAFAAMAEPGADLVIRSELELRTIAAERERIDANALARTWADLGDAWAAIEAPYESWYCIARCGTVTVASGRADEGARLMSAAFAGAERLGAKPMSAWIRDAARRLGVVLERGPAPSAGSRRRADGVTKEAALRPYGLTSRELEILELLAKGRTNRQIAYELSISENTAGVHVSHVLGKLGVSSRTEAALVGAGMDLGSVEG